MQVSLSAIPITELSGVSEKIAKKLAKLGLYSAQDLLLHLPSRYEDKTQLLAINKLYPGLWTGTQGVVTKAEINGSRRKMLIVTLFDGTGSIRLRFFNFSPAMVNQFSIDKSVQVYGEIKSGTQLLEIVHPEYQFFNAQVGLKPSDKLTPIYPTTEGIKQYLLRNLVDQALDLLTPLNWPELIPSHLMPTNLLNQHQEQYLSSQQAFKVIHHPSTDENLELFLARTHPALQTFIIEELLAQYLSLSMKRSKEKAEVAWGISPSKQLAIDFLAQLPFRPTNAQQRVAEEITKDMSASEPMLRLVQGDVGSGKTLVAALAALPVIEQGHQVALMVPTELLAEQHQINFSQWFAPLGIEVAVLTGKLKTVQKNALLTKLTSGTVQMVIGTHALFQKQVQFHNLALMIIDEQHRFGVHQRLALREKNIDKNQVPHQLVMTATPIPRTLAMTAYADLDISIIDELPPGRTPVKTIVISDQKRNELIERILNTCKNEQRQVYWVCTLIDDSDAVEAKAAADTAVFLQTALPDLAIGLVHGRMKPTEKQKVMERFKQRDLDLLVATTVIEVGVDVANASLMIIENPERLGLAQLHQLRGRVGRGSVESHCVLMYQSPLSDTAKLRLNALRETNDGFLIAQKDLSIRGPGELLGTKQTGFADLKIADLLKDEPLLGEAQRIGKLMIKEHPDNAKKILERWFGNKEKYSYV